MDGKQAYKDDQRVEAVKEDHHKLEKRREIAVIVSLFFPIQVYDNHEVG
jgi:hypothetical protein